MRPISAFLVIDMQNDFIDGPLAIKNGPAGEDGAEVITPINDVSCNILIMLIYNSIILSVL